MSWQRGWGEATPGTDARPVDRGRMVTLSQGELADMVRQQGKVRANRAFAYAAAIFVTLGFGAGKAFGADSLFALYLGLVPTTGGASVTVYGGVLTTQELCVMAGDGIATSLEASVADIDVKFACIPVPTGESA